MICFLCILFVAASGLADDPATTEQVAKLKKLGARITHDDQNRIIGIHLGERPVVDADLVHLRGLQHVQELDLTRTRVTGPGLTNLKDLTALKKLFLTDTKVADAAMVHLKGLKNLGLLGLSGTKIGDAGLSHLESLSQLKQVFCIGANVTDAGVEKFQRALPQCDVTH